MVLVLVNIISNGAVIWLGMVLVIRQQECPTTPDLHPKAPTEALGTFFYIYPIVQCPSALGATTYG
jgi:hypothetical protein